MRKIEEKGKKVIIVEKNVFKKMKVEKSGYVIENGRVVMEES